MQFVILAVALAHIVNAQISTAGCTNLRAVFTAFGFTTAPTTAVNTAFTSCGCSFTVTVPAGSTAAAACQLTSDVWSINSVSISRPPNTLSAFPPVLVAPSNSAGFEWCQSLSFTNNALTGGALSLAEYLPSRTSSLDLSNNPGLAQWPATNPEGTIPNLSFQTITLTGNTGLCCPAQGPNGNLPSCIPATLPRCAAATRVVVPTTTAAAANPAAGGSGSENGAVVPTGTGGLNVWIAPTPSKIPYISPINAPGTIFVICLGVLLFIGGFVLGGVMYYSRKNQGPVVIVDEDLELENGRKSALGNRVAPVAGPSSSSA